MDMEGFLWCPPNGSDNPEDLGRKRAENESEGYLDSPSDGDGVAINPSAVAPWRNAMGTLPSLYVDVGG